MPETLAEAPTITVDEDIYRPSGPIVPESPVQLTEPCSAHRCANGHVWPVFLGAAPCGGCKAAVVAIKLTNCPICNEPVVSTRLRIEHTTAAVGVQAVCQGIKTTAHTKMIELDLKALTVGPVEPPTENTKK